MAKKNSFGNVWRIINTPDVDNCRNILTLSQMACVCVCRRVNTLVPKMICLSPGTKREQRAYSQDMVRITCRVDLWQQIKPSNKRRWGGKKTQDIFFQSIFTCSRL